MLIPVKDVVVPRGYDTIQDDSLLFRVEELETRVDYRWGPRSSVTEKLSNPRYREAPLFLSPGTWDLNSSFQTQHDGEHVAGVGYYTILRSNGATPMWTITHDRTVIRGVRFTDNGNAVTRMISASGADYVTIDGCSFSFSTTSAAAIHLSDCNNVTIKNCTIAYSGSGASTGIYLLDCNNAMIENNRILGVDRGSSGIAVNLDSTGTGSPSTRCNDCIVSGNHVSSSGSIRYNTSGNHLVGDSTVSGQATLNNVSAALVAY